MNESKTKTELITSFVNMLQVVKLDDVPDVMEVSINVAANVVGCGIMRRLTERCECKTCRVEAKAALNMLMEQVLSQTKECLDANMKANGYEPLYGPTSHNESIAKEIEREIERSENKD